MQNHLESVLANEPVTVKSGAQIVEVTPQVWMMMPCVLRRCLDKCMIGCGCVNSHQP
jgi:hypothetical protein